MFHYIRIPSTVSELGTKTFGEGSEKIGYTKAKKLKRPISKREKIKTMAAAKGAWLIQQCVAFNLLYQRHSVLQPTAAAVATRRHA